MIEKQLREMAEKAINGDVNELDVYIELNNISKLVDSLKKEVLPSAIHQANMEDSKTFDRGNYTITKSQKTTWEYKHLEGWNTIKNNLKEFEERAKKAHGMREVIIDQDTGEVIEPAHKKVTDTLMIKIKK